MTTATKWTMTLGGYSRVYRSDDGQEVRDLPNGWIGITLADGRNDRVSINYTESGGEWASFMDAIDEARPFAEAMAEALGGRVELTERRQEWTQRVIVRMGRSTLPPIPLAESDPHDEDE